MSFPASVKALDHVVHQFGIDVRMIDQMNQHAVAVCIRLQVADRGLQRGQLAQLVIRVDDNLHRQMLDPLLHLLGVVAENNGDPGDWRLFQRGDNFFDESLPFDRQQRLRASHAARFTGG